MSLCCARVVAYFHRGSNAKRFYAGSPRQRRRVRVAVSLAAVTRTHDDDCGPPRPPLMPPATRQQMQSTLHAVTNGLAEERRTAPRGIQPRVA